MQWVPEGGGNSVGEEARSRKLTKSGYSVWGWATPETAAREERSPGRNRLGVGDDMAGPTRQWLRTEAEENGLAVG
jgi:hypothetical protein